MPENIGPDEKADTARLWVITLLGEAAFSTSTYVCSSAANFWRTRRAAAIVSARVLCLPVTNFTPTFDTRFDLDREQFLTVSIDREARMREQCRLQCAHKKSKCRVNPRGFEDRTVLKEGFEE